MDNVTGKTAQEIVDHFHIMRSETTETISEIKELCNSAIDATKASLLLRITILSVKVSEANIFTRWYWKKELKKAEDKYDEIIKID